MLLAVLEHLVVGVVAAMLLGLYLRRGREEVLRVLLVGVRHIPGVQGLVDGVLHREATSFLQQAKIGSATGSAQPPKVLLPEEGVSHAELRQELERLRQKEVNQHDGQIFAYVYTLDDDHFDLQVECFSQFEEAAGFSPDHDAFVKEVHHAFLHENALNPMLYPSLRLMETEIVSMTAGLLHGGQAAEGFLTSGGTESVLMAVKTFRDRAKKLFPHIKHPEIVAPITAHPVVDKAGHYFGVKVIHTPVGPDQKADVKELEKAITSNTILIYVSAPQFCHGIVDPIEEVSNMALRRGIPIHVDACFGGFMLPWVEKLGYDIPKWDFRVPGVMSISADTHKYGYCVKGSSVILYRNAEIRKHQIFTYAEWPGGLYGSPSMAGTRPGGNIAATWASMKALGVQGYMKKAKELMDITESLKEGIAKIDGLTIIGHPHMTCFAIGSSHPDVDILAVADAMEKRGWKMERQQKPSCLHCSILPHHQVSRDRLLADLASCTQEVKGNKQLAKEGTAGMYGMMASIPDKVIINDFITEFFSEVYKVK